MLENTYSKSLELFIFWQIVIRILFTMKESGLKNVLAWIYATLLRLNKVGLSTIKVI